jgi:hypothetical protein
LISYDGLVIKLIVENHPPGANEASDVREQTFELAKDGVRHKSEEGTMFVNSNGPIVGLGKGFVMVGGPDVGFVVVFFGCNAEVDDELLRATDSQVGVDEGDVLLLRFLRHQRIETLLINWQDL